MIIASGIGAFLLAIIHFSVDKLNFSYIPRSKWLSAAGGISVAYIFIHVLPELQQWQETFVEETTLQAIEFLEHHLYLIALLGLAIFYGLERAAKLSKQSHRSATGNDMPHNTRIFWIHIFSFSIYNFLIGYLLFHREENNLRSFALFVVAMAFHFLVNDYGLLDHYKEDYKKKGRWIIAVAIIAGWLVGVLTEIQEVYIGIMFAFIAGGVILNVLKEELPEERKSNFWAFSLGVIAYAVLLLII